MDNSEEKKVPMQPRNMAELLPGIKAILTEDTIRHLTLQRKRPTAVQTQAIDKVTRPLTIAEIKALTGPLNKKKPQPTPSTRLKPWNSSIKVDKMKSVTATAEGQRKCRTARKVLNFQPKSAKKPEVTANTWKIMTNSVAKKSYIPTQGNTKALPIISGINKIVATPVLKKQQATKIKNVSFMCNNDDSFLLKEKEINEFQEKCNLLDVEPIERIAEVSPPFSIPFKEHRSIEDHCNSISLVDNSITNNNTIMYDKKSDLEDNNTRKESVIVSICEIENSNIDNSEYFNTSELIKEYEYEVETFGNMRDTLKNIKERRLQIIQKFKSKDKTVQSSKAVKKEEKEKCNLLDEEAIERIAEVSQPFSTPFKKHISIEDPFNSTNLVDNAITNNNTIMYDKKSDLEDNNKRKESVIVSICEVDSSNNDNSEYFNVSELIKEYENEVDTFDNMRDTLDNMIERCSKIIQKLKSKDKTVQSSKAVKKEDKENIVECPKNSSTVIKAKSPSYKIPRKSIYSTNNFIRKTMPNISNGIHTPMKSNSLALSMYMEIKDQMNFLSTPLKKHRNVEAPDTPAITSRNLQNQLDKLYNQ